MKRKSYSYNSDQHAVLLEIKRELVDSCKVCGGSGYVTAKMEGAVHRCECMTIFRYLKALVKAGIPADYWYLTLEELRVESSMRDAVNEYIDNLKSAHWQGIGLLFTGPNGIGKTSCQCIIGEYAVAQGFRVSYITLPQYIDMVTQDNDRALAHVRSAEFLLLDELDKAYMKSGSDYVSKKLDELLRFCGAPGPALITCTNWDEDDIKSRYGKSILSMLRRKVHIISATGAEEDYSEVVQANLLAKLRKKIQYRHPAVTRMALMMENHHEQA